MKKQKLAGVICAGVFSLGFASTADAASVSGQGTWETTLLARDLDGNAGTTEAYYDTTLDITWLADANFSMTTGFDADGRMVWAMANSWASSLNISNITGWRLPSVSDSGAPGCQFSRIGGTDCGYNVDTSTGEMASLYLDTLGNLSAFDTSGDLRPSFGLSNTGLFLNVQAGHYNTSTELVTDNTLNWDFRFHLGEQGLASKGASSFAWAVHDGDVGSAVVPIPAAAWLFGSGLIGLLGMAKRERHTRQKGSV